MKLLCLNTNKGKKITEIIDFIKQTNADFVALQEVYGFQLKKYKEKAKFEFTYFSPSLVSKQQGEYGNLFMSKAKILSSSTKFIDGKFVKNFIYPPEGVSFDNEPRTMQILNIDAKGKELKIINLHGVYQLNGYKGDSERMNKMCEKIVSEYKKGTPTVICGDFNLTPNTDCIRKISTTLKKVSGLEEDQKTIDYIFTSDEIILQKFKREKIRISDHYPLLYEFSLQEEGV